MSAPALPTAQQKAVYVNRMFAGIAHRYDLTNRLITGGQDVRWRRQVIELCRLPDPGRLLDVGAGTGDIAYEARRQHPCSEIVGCDFTFEMMAAGRKRRKERPPRRARAHAPESIEFVQGDGLSLPFADGYFDAVTSGFLLRNVADVDTCLTEQRRVTKPGGRVVCLETSPPPQTLLQPVLRFYMLKVIPLLAQLVAAPRGANPFSAPVDAYRYLPQSAVAFLSPEDLARRMELAGFRDVSFKRRMLGTIAIHVGIA